MMKKTIPVLLLAMVVCGSAASRTRVAFRHQVTFSSTRTTLDHPLLNGDPAAIIVVTQTVGPANPHPVDVFYNSTQRRWQIWNSDLANIPLGTVFQVLVVEAQSAFVHITSPTNILAHLTLLDHPSLNGRAGARPIITVRATADSMGIATTTEEYLGTWYDSFTSRWTVFNQDTAALMPEDLRINVFVPGEDEDTILHLNDSGGTNLTVLDYHVLRPAIANKQSVLVSQHWEGVYNDHPIGLDRAGSWWIYNVDSANLPLNATFNVYVAPILADGFESGTTGAWSPVSP